jgi:hypothetical protein
MAAFTFTPHSRFGGSYLWNVYIDKQIVAKVSLEHNGKIWVNVLKHGAKTITPEMEAEIQAFGESIAKSKEICNVCHLHSQTPLCHECELKHRMEYHSLIIKTSAGQKFHCKPTLDFYHLTEDQFRIHINKYCETGELPNVTGWN